jgi:PhnB protein
MNVHELFVYLCVRDAKAAIAFYAEAFEATEKLRLTESGGRIGHAEVAIGGHVVMLSEPFPEMGVVAPEPGRPSSFCIHLHVDDADAVIARAAKAGATVVRPPQDAFYGERSGRIRDPFGHEWLVGHPIEDVAPEEMQRRYEALTKEPGAP